MKIICVDKDVKATLETGYFIIPRFQRPYLWERENVEEFWNDSVANPTDEHFIGSIVVFRTRDSKYGIVDGQQRLTTITMILCILRNALDAAGFSDLAKGVHLLVERPDIGNKNQFVLQTETSYPYLQEYIQKFGKPEAEPTHGKEEEHLKLAFNTLSSSLREIVEQAGISIDVTSRANRKKLQTLFEKIRDRILSLKLIFIELDHEDDAYFVFETLNTRGKDLRLADLVKNHVTRLLRPKNQNVDLAKDKWNKIVDLIEENDKISLDSFLHHYWLSKYEYITIKKLFKSLRKVIKSSNARPFLDELIADSRTYKEIREPSLAKWSKQESSINNSLKALNDFQVKQDLPMRLAVMRSYRDGEIKKKHADFILQALENFHFMFTSITSQRSSGGISLMYALHARQFTNAKTLETKVRILYDLIKKLRAKRPSYQEFEANFIEKLYSKEFPKDKALVQYILGRLYQHFDRSGVPVDFSQMTIEHIAAEKPNKPKSALSSSSIAQIGNLLLVDQALNLDLANKEFHEKKPILISSNVWLDLKIRSAKKWGKKEIEDRTRFLAKEAYYKVWKF